METLSASLALCAGNSPVTGEFPAQRPVTWSFDVFFDLHLNIRLSKQSWGWWFETQASSLWRHCNVCLHCCMRSVMPDAGDRLSIQRLSYKYKDPHVKDIHILPWSCVWDVCYIILCHVLHIHSGKTGILFSSLLCSLWWVQIVGHVMACRSYSFVCTLNHLIIIIVQTYL